MGRLEELEELRILAAKERLEQAQQTAETDTLNEFLLFDLDEEGNKVTPCEVRLAKGVGCFQASLMHHEQGWKQVSEGMGLIAALWALEKAVADPTSMRLPYQSFLARKNGKKKNGKKDSH